MSYVMAFTLTIGVTLCAMSSADEVTRDKSWLIGDESLKVTLTQDSEGKISESVTSHGTALAYLGAPCALKPKDADWQILEKAENVGAGSLETGSMHSGITLHGSLSTLNWRVTYEHIGPGMVTKELILEPVGELFLEHVAMATFTIDTPPEIASTSLQDMAVFCRNGANGIFLSLDFPYSRISTEGDLTRVTYPPFVALEQGQKHACHTLTMGATQLTGEIRYGRDTGEVDAIDSYIQNRYPQRFDRPMYVTSCINNRYTMPEGGMVWYTYKDHPTLSFNQELMKREIELMPEIGIEYYHFFPGVFDWVGNDPDREVIREIVAHAEKHGVRVGDYSGTTAVFCPHYNEYGNTLDRPDWLMRDPDGNPGAYCYGSPEFASHYTETVVSAAREFGFQFHCLDFLAITPCYADHGHPKGMDGVYHQVAGLVTFLEALAEVHPEMMSWSNSGNWIEFLPKLVWANPNVYVTDPYIATHWQGLNMTRLLDDARREQMVELHYTRFIPYRNFTNCQYFFSQNSVVPDIRNYQYGALSNFAVTPNISLAEIRPWMDRLSPGEQEEVKAFYKHWTQFFIKHFDLWKKTHHVGSDPAPGSVEIYGHADGNHGFAFIVNPNYWSETVEIPLDGRLGFDGHGKCEVREIYPGDYYLLTDAGPQPSFGETFHIEAPAQQVRILEVTSAPALVQLPRVYGIPGNLEEADNGYVLHTSGPQGETRRFEVRLPEGSAPITGAKVRLDIPKQAKRLFAETPLNILEKKGTSTLLEVTYRRSKAPAELRNWRLLAGDDMTLPENPRLGFETGGTQVFPIFGEDRGPLSNFLGAYVENAFSEDQETWIELLTDVDSPQITAESKGGIKAADETNTSYGNGTSWWLSTDLHLPFMYTIGAEPAFYEHTLLVLPMRDPARVKSMEAWVNGVPLNVQRYAFPRNRALSTYWADLVGSGAHGGDNRLVVYVEFLAE